MKTAIHSDRPVTGPARRRDKRTPEFIIYFLFIIRGTCFIITLFVFIITFNIITHFKYQVRHHIFF